MAKNSKINRDKKSPLNEEIRQVAAPGDYHPFGILNVWLKQDEDVIWNWAHVDGKSYVSGYSIRKKTIFGNNSLPKNW